MATETQQVAQNSSTAVAANPATSNTPVQTSGAIPTPTPVVAPKGFRQELQQMLQGWQTVIPSGSTVQSSNGGSLGQAAVLAQLQGYLGVYTDLDAHVTALQQVRTQERSQALAARQYLDVLRAAVAFLFGAGSPQLVQFGIQPKKPHKALTSTALAARAAKAAATRKLRGTTSKKQKALIKSGPMKVSVVAVQQAVQQATQGSASQGNTVASTAPGDPAVNAASPPTK
jgi:hypothetical protein